MNVGRPMSCAILQAATVTPTSEHSKFIQGETYQFSFLRGTMSHSVPSTFFPHPFLKATYISCISSSFSFSQFVHKTYTSYGRVFCSRELGNTSPLTRITLECLCTPLVSRSSPYTFPDLSSWLYQRPGRLPLPLYSPLNSSPPEIDPICPSREHAISFILHPFFSPSNLPLCLSLGSRDFLFLSTNSQLNSQQKRRLCDSQRINTPIRPIEAHPGQMAYEVKVPTPKTYPRTRFREYQYNRKVFLIYS